MQYELHTLKNNPLSSLDNPGSFGRLMDTKKSEFDLRLYIPSGEKKKVL